jgi:DNA-binding transcriptional ArsR family regulator
MAEWVADTSNQPVVPAWTVRSSLTIEWFWALLAHSPEDGFPVREAFYAGAPQLTERSTTFWDDGCHEYIELVVLAKRAGCLWEGDGASILAALRSVALTGVGDETLDSEEPQVAQAIRRRLDRLAHDPDLRADWLELMAEVDQAVRPLWESEGRFAVDSAVRNQSRVAARSTSWPDLLQEPGCTWTKLVPELAQRTLRAGGQVILVPSYLARKSFLLSFGDLVLLGSGVGHQTLPSDATRVAARRLRALADPTRLAVMEQLALRPRSVGQLAKELQVTQPTISNHVRILREAGVLHDSPRPDQRQLAVTADGVLSLLDDVRTLILGAAS